MKSSIICLALAVTSLSTAISQGALYSVTDLGSLGGTFGFANAINNAGQVVGSSGISTYPVAHTFLWDGTMHDLGSLGGNGGGASAISSNGLIAGTSYLPGNSNYQAFIYNGSIQQVAGVGGPFHNGNGINASGSVTGYGQDSNGQYQGFISTGGVVTTLGPAGEQANFTNPQAINNAGHVTGTIKLADGNWNILYYDGALHGIPTLGGVRGTGYAINDSNQIAGGAQLADNFTEHAFFYDGSMHDLGALGGNFARALALNNSGKVVGFSSLDNAIGVEHAFVADIINGMVDLNTQIYSGSGWVLQRATGINDSGKIVGFGTFNGQTRPFLLTLVPEPSSALLAIVGALSLAGLRVLRRRK